MSKYREGQIVYIVESSAIVREAQILRITGDFYTLRFTNTHGGIKVRGSRLFESREAAEEILHNVRKSSLRTAPHPHLDEAKFWEQKK